MEKKKISIIADKAKNEGGANIAAIRIANILSKEFSIKIIQPKKDVLFKLKNLVAKILIKIFIGKTEFLNSLNIFDNIDKKEIENKLLHIHWIGKETISLNTLIKKDLRIIWTLHDMWPVNSTEHFVNDLKNHEYNSKYFKKNFLKKFIFEKKKKLFQKKKIILITCCKWLEKIVKNSENTKNLEVQTIYNPIETEIWKRKNKILSKKKLNLDSTKNYILFGAHGGLSNPRKGGDLLLRIIKKMNKFLIKNNYEFIVLGGKKDYREEFYGLYLNHRKHVSNKLKQVLYHSAVELTLSCARAEALPQFLVETLLCKNPVVTFDVGGVNEIISHKKNGYLVKKFNLNDFEKGLKFIINNKKKLKLEKKIKFIKREFNENNVLKKYRKIVKKITYENKIY